MNWRTTAVFGVLLGVAVAMGLAAGSAASESTAPSVDNPGPQGTAVLFRWLTERGAQVGRLDQDFTSLDAQPNVQTLVIVAPRAQAIEQREVEAVDRFLARGGTVVYLAPRRGTRSAFDHWLGVTHDSLPAMSDEPSLNDPAGATARVEWASGLARGLESLRISGDQVISVEAAVPVTSPAALWFRPVGRGEVWVGAGPDLAESARLELLDNAAFWLHVAARGPMVFDEFHQRAAATTPLTVNVVATTLQFLACAALFVWSRAVRLGPARPTTRPPHRSSLEYVRAMRDLMAGARVDTEIVAQLRRDVRASTHERLGISLGLGNDEWVRDVATATELPAAEVGVIFQSEQLLAVAQAVARVELQVLGAGEKPRPR